MLDGNKYQQPDVPIVSLTIDSLTIRENSILQVTISSLSGNAYFRSPKLDINITNSQLSILNTIMKEVYIISAVRTPIGSFGGALSSMSATQLGAAAIKAALEKAKLDPKEVQEVYMGNVLSAGIGQAPVTQASIWAGVPNTVPGTTINKVCASGMKAIMVGAESIMLGDNDVVVAGGMESMSNVPYYLDKARNGYRLGHGSITDGLVKDGLWDVYKDYHMGSAAELCATELSC